MPAASKALAALVRDAKSRSEFLRSQSGPVMPGGQANSTGAAKSSSSNCLTFAPRAGIASIIIFD